MHGSQGREEVVVVVVGRSTGWKHNSQTYDYCFNQILLECGKRFVVSWWHCTIVIVWWIPNYYDHAYNNLMMLICFIGYFLKYCKRLYISSNIAEGHIFPQILQNLIYLSRSSWYKLLAPFPIESISYKRDCDCDAMKDNCTVNDVDDGENVPSIRSRAPSW